MSEFEFVFADMADIGSLDVVDSREFEVSFHGYDYVVNVSVPGDFLDIQVEQERSNDRWRGRFTAQYIEVRELRELQALAQWTLVSGCTRERWAWARVLCSPKRTCARARSLNVRHPYSCPATFVC